MSAVKDGPGGAPVVYTAAHAGFKGLGHPLGGAAAISDRLSHEWSLRPRWPLILIGPGPVTPTGLAAYERLPKMDDTSATDLTRLSEWGYARFCTRFSAAITERILNLAGPDKRQLRAVLVNDISEGPDFRRLSAAGLPLVTIFHVDVVDYFCHIYLQNRISPEAATKLYRGLCKAGVDRIPFPILQLLLGRQQAAVDCSQAIVVPSKGMKQRLLNCYPGLPDGRVHVVPWGCWREGATESAVVESVQRISRQIAGSPRPVLLSLSRVAPEKGLDILLDALQIRESRSGAPVTLLLAGAPAYMRGQTYLRSLRLQAARLKESQVIFVGQANPADKQALFSLSDLYLFPSRYEAFGLTLCEAVAAGLPVITTDHYSARDLVPPGSGEIVPRDDAIALAGAIDRFVAVRKHSNLDTFRTRQRPPEFSVAAEYLADIIDSVHPEIACSPRSSSR